MEFWWKFRLFGFFDEPEEEDLGAWDIDEETGSVYRPVDADTPPETFR